MTISDKMHAILSFFDSRYGATLMQYSMWCDILRKQEIYILLATRCGGKNRVQRQFSDKSELPISYCADGLFAVRSVAIEKRSVVRSLPDRYMCVCTRLCALANIHVSVYMNWLHFTCKLMYRDLRDTRAQDAPSLPREWLICRREDGRNLRLVPRCVIWVLDNRNAEQLDSI